MSRLRFLGLPVQVDAPVLRSVCHWHTAGFAAVPCEHLCVCRGCSRRPELRWCPVCLRDATPWLEIRLADVPFELPEEDPPPAEPAPPLRPRAVGPRQTAGGPTAHPGAAADPSSRCGARPEHSSASVGGHPRLVSVSQHPRSDRAPGKAAPVALHRRSGGGRINGPADRAYAL